MSKFAFIAALAAVSITPAIASAFERISDRGEFVDLIVNKDLTRLGITLTVSEAGAIKGRAFGRSVTGQWQWNDGYFCRDLYYGEQNLGPNCQMVETNGSKVRFTSDRGAGQSADLRLD